MLALGLLAVFQITALPGLLLIRLFDSKRGFIQNLAYVFTLSMLANYAGVLILVALGLYFRTVVLGIFVVEIWLLLRLYRTSFRRPMAQFGAEAIAAVSGAYQKVASEINDFAQSASKLVGSRGAKQKEKTFRDFLFSLLRVVFGLAAVGTILWMGFIVVDQIGTVYQEYDSWGIWDPWAVDWAQNKPASNTWTYSQLIPVNNSLTYVFIGASQVKFFAKGIMPLFTLLMLLLIFDLGKKKESFGYFLGVGVAFFGINRFMGKYLAEGYVDLAVAAFSLLAIYTILKSREVKDKGELGQMLVLGSLATAAAAVTKQQGFYMLAFYPILSYFIVLKDYSGMQPREKLSILLRPLLLGLVIVVPWYVYTGVQISRGVYPLNIGYVIDDIYGGLTLAERFAAAVDSLDRYAWIYGFLLLALPFLGKAMRWIVVTIIFPYSILWAFFLSYEHRNLAIAFPLVGLAAGAAVEGILRRFRYEKLRGYAILAFAGLALLLGSTILTSGRLVERQTELQKKILHTQLNDFLYSYFEDQDPPDMITDYPLDWLPGFEGTWRVDRFRDYASYQAGLISRPEVEYLLVPILRAEENILNEVQANIDAGIYKTLYTHPYYILLKIPPR